MATTRNRFSQSPIKPRLWLRSLLVLLWCIASQATAQAGNNEPLLGNFTLGDLRTSALLFVNSTASPGVDSSQLYVNDGSRLSEIARSSLGYGGDITVRDTVWDFYWGAALSVGHIDEDLVIEENLQQYQLIASRDVTSVRGSVGASLMLLESLKIRPFFSLYYSDYTAQSVLADGTSVVWPAPGNLGAFHSSEAYALTSAGSLELDWQHWFNRYQWRLSGQYNLAYTDFYSEKSPHLDTWGWNAIAFAKARLSGATPWQTWQRDWRWFAYSNYTNYIDQPKSALGFTRFLETGLGIELMLNLKPLDWFGFRAIGFKAGYIVGDNVTGFNIGMVMR